MDLKFPLAAGEQEEGYSMLPSDFDFAMLPEGATETTLKELGMLSSDIENIDYSITSWLKENLKLSSRTNEGFTMVPVLWQTPERAFQIKDDLSLRDDGGAFKLPFLSIERTGIVKDPTRKGAFQAQIYSSKGNGRSGRLVVAKRIVEDKTRNFAVANGTRTTTEAASRQKWSPRVNSKVVIQTLSIPIPIYINVDYKIVIKAEYQQQINELTIPFLTRTGQINSFLLRRNGHLYEAFIDQSFSHSNNVADMQEDSRLFTTEFSIKILGYLIGEGPNDDRQLVKVTENAVTVTYPRETATSAWPGQKSLIPND
jgi:hypothetical protein